MSTFPKSAKIATAAAAIGAMAVGAWVALAPGNQPVTAAPVTAAVPAGPEAAPAPAAAPSTPAKTTILALLPRPGSEQACSADGLWCVSMTPPDDEGVRRPVVRPGGQAGSSAAPEANDSGETYAVWPTLIALGDGGFLTGVETRLSTSYSGGGGSATELRLFRLSNDAGASDPVLVLPVQGSLLIRACFSEADLEKRGEACHDEYGFTGKLEIETANGAMPALAYSTNAWAFPRGASRDEDSTTRGPLTAADLVRETDRTCSFSRRFVFDTRRGAYAPDRPLPDCSNYTTP